MRIPDNPTPVFYASYLHRHCSYRGNAETGAASDAGDGSEATQARNPSRENQDDD